MEKGIKEVKELVVFIASVASAGDKATKDGLGVEDVAHFIAPLMLAPEAFKGINEAKLEVANLDTAEMAELKDAFAAELDLADDGLEAMIEKSLVIALELYKLVKEIGVLRKA